VPRVALPRKSKRDLASHFMSIKGRVKPIIGFEIWFSIIYAAGLTVFQALGDFTESEVDFLSIDAAQAVSHLVKDA